MEPLSSRELARYDRHITLPQVGLEGQKRLKSSKVLLIGVGGLGSPAALYLAAAGVGRLGIVEFDRVDESNLQRQVLYGVASLGRSKAQACAERLTDLNPHLEVALHETQLKAENALEIIEPYDLVLDGADNFATRYLVNDACVMLGKPNVHGSIYRFEGQVSLFHPSAGGPCYRCLFPSPPPSHTVPSCAEGGVFGVLPGVVGSLQATEAIKWVVGAGRGLLGRLLTFDALAMRFSELKIPKDPNCPVCGESPTITSLEDCVQVCEASNALGISPREFHQKWLDGWRPVLLDVREPHEWEIVNLLDYRAKLVPLAELSKHLENLSRTDEIVVYCKSGGRSVKARSVLLEAGFENVKNLSGGILRFAEEVDSGLRRY